MTASLTTTSPARLTHAERAFLFTFGATAIFTACAPVTRASYQGTPQSEAKTRGSLRAMGVDVASPSPKMTAAQRREAAVLRSAQILGIDRSRRANR